MVWLFFLTITEVYKMLIKSAKFYENHPNLMPNLTKNLEF